METITFTKKLIIEAVSTKVYRAHLTATEYLDWSFSRLEARNIDWMGDIMFHYRVLPNDKGELTILEVLFFDQEDVDSYLTLSESVHNTLNTGFPLPTFTVVDVDIPLNQVTKDFSYNYLWEV